MSGLFNLLIAEDDATLVAALKLMIPDGFKIYVTQNPDLIPDHVFFTRLWSICISHHASEKLRMVRM